MAMYMNNQTCLLCSEKFSTKDLRTSLCDGCKHHANEVKKYRGLGGRLSESTKRKILETKTLRSGSGHRYDYFDKGGKHDKT